MILSTDRVEFFSDCIIAIIITIMAFDVGASVKREISLSTEFGIFVKMLPGLLIYLFSFIMLGICWVSHHHFYHMVRSIDIKLLWFNLNMLFWLSLIPFATYMLGKGPLVPLSTAMYGFVMLMVSMGFALSLRYGLRQNLALGATVKELNDVQKVARGTQTKAKIEMSLYCISIILSFVYAPLTYMCFIAAAILYFLPDEVKNRRLAKILYEEIKQVHG
jgi:uncharacterized membrane protein